jgi:hypothetical protein
MPPTKAIFSTLETTDTSATSLVVGGGLTATKGGFSGPVSVDGGTLSDAGLAIASSDPADKSMKLYNNSGTLTWNGAPLAAGSSLSGTTGTVAKFTASNAVGDSIMTESGAVITVTSTLNATAALQIGGASINTAGTLANVAYLNAANNFTNASGQTFAGGIGLSGGSPSTHGINIPSAVPGVLTTNLHNNAGLLIWTGGATFPGNVTVTTLNTYTFNQSVASGATPTFTGTNITGVPAASVLAGTFGVGDFTFTGDVKLVGTGDRLLIGASAFATSRTVEIWDTDPIIATIITGPTPGTNEAAWAAYSETSTTALVKIGAQAFLWTDNDNTSGYASWNVHPAYMVAGVQTDEYSIAAFGAHGVAVFPADLTSSSAPGDKVFQVNGTVTTTVGYETTSALADLTGLTMTAGTTTRPAVTFRNATTGDLGQLFFANDGAFEIRRKAGGNAVLSAWDASGNQTNTGSVDAPSYKVGGVAGLASFSGAVTNITVVNGIVTAAS